MNSQATDIETQLNALGDSVEAGNWARAGTLVVELHELLEQVCVDDPEDGFALFTRARDEISRLERVSRARRVSVGDRLRELGRGRKAVRQYA